MQKRSEAGVGHVLLLFLVVAVAAVIGLVGWRVMQNNGDQAEEVTATQPVAKVSAPDQINSAADLTKAQAALNQTNVDQDVNPSSLDADVNSLL
jgi:predicted negative regulator of RcsB-dependent stress response